MAYKRTHLEMVKHSSCTVKADNLLQLTIVNQGTKEFIVNSKAIVRPGGFYNVPAVLDLTMVDGKEYQIQMSGTTTEENNAYIAYSSLVVENTNC